MNETPVHLPAKMIQPMGKKGEDRKQLLRFLPSDFSRGYTINYNLRLNLVKYSLEFV